MGHQASAGDGRVRRVDRPARVSSLASQWRYFRARYPQHLLLVQVVKRWDCQVPAVKRLLTRHAQPWLEVCENGWVRGGRKKQRQLLVLWPGLAKESDVYRGFVS